MTDFPDFDPKTIPQQGDQHKAAVRSNQAEFQTAFGDFKSRHVTGFWIGPAPKGEWVGIHFDMEDGSTVKVAVPYIYWQQFGNEFALAMMTAAELCEAAYAPPKGRA